MEFGLLAAAVLALGALRLALLPEGADAGRLWDLALTATIAGLATGRLTAMVASGVNPLTHPLDILVVRGGVSSVAATFGVLAMAAWRSRDDLWATLDALAAPALYALAGWHAGCVFTGSCLGTATDLPWGVAATAGSVPRHPTEAYAAVLLLVAATAVWLLRRNGRTRAGVLVSAAAVAVAAIRLATEPLRASFGSGRTTSYAIGLALSVGLLAWRRWRPDGYEGGRLLPR